MAGEGVILRKVREEKGWTYQDVEASIKIRVRYLTALENEDYDVLPGATYTRGFLRTYAKLLGLNADEIINLYNSSAEKETAPVAHPPLTPIHNTPLWYRPVVVVAMAFIAVAIVVGITYFSKLNNNPSASDYTPTPLPTVPQTNNPAAEPNGQNPTAQPQPPATIKYEGIVAELTFEQDCWLQVRVDGIMVLNGMNPAGTTKVLQGSRSIEFVTIGNAGGLGLKINGKDVPSLGAARQPVYNYVITEETLNNL